jgi:hypothetical protein
MLGVLRLLALGREDLTVVALAALVVAGAIVALGAWLLFFREARRTDTPEPSEEEDRAARS